jgi:hypothetical protein
MGDVIVMEYDGDWNYLGMKELIKDAHWSTGLAFDGERFYVAYRHQPENRSWLFTRLPECASRRL